MRHFLTLCFLFHLSVSVVGADEYNDPAAAKAGAESAMQLIASGKTQEALDGLKQYWPLPASEVDRLVLQIKNGMGLLGERFGKSIGIEKISEKTVGESFYQVQFLQKFSHHALVWNFRFYKPNTKWIVNSITFSDKVEALF